MIDVIDILQNSNSRDFSRNAGKETIWLLCIISYHHELVIELGKDGFDSFSESPVCPNRWTPVLLVKPIRHLQRDMSDIKQVLLNVGAKIPFIAKHQTVVVLPFDILKVIEVMYICRGHVIAVNDTAYSADCMELISIIMHVLGGAVSPCRRQLRNLPAHGATCCPCVLAYFDWFGVYAEYIFASVHCQCYILADFFPKSVSELAALIVLATGYKMWKFVGAFIPQPIKQVVFTVEAEDFCRSGKRKNLQIGKLWDDTSARYVSEVIYTISGKFYEYVENFSELYDEVVHKRDDSNQWFGHH